MKTSCFFLLLLTCIFWACTNPGLNEKFSLKNIPSTVMKKKGNEIFQYWDFKNVPNLWESNIESPVSLKLYKDSLEIKLSRDTLKNLIQKLAFQNKTFKWVNTSNGDSINAQLVHANKIGKIRPTNNLESQLLDFQISRYPLLSRPTEFHGFILKHDSLNLIRVYFAGSDKPWPPKPNLILEALAADFKNGWKLTFHLHNHYEPQANGYLGILAPSTSDA